MIRIAKTSTYRRDVYVGDEFAFSLIKNIYGNWVGEYNGHTHIYESMREARRYLKKIKPKSEPEKVMEPLEKKLVKKKYPEIIEEGYSTTIVTESGRRCTRYYVEDPERFAELVVAGYL